MSAGRCKICGCTENRACMTNIGPCHWMQGHRRQLCSGCHGAQNAGELAERLGKKLVGCLVKTEAIGEWPGGLCQVIKIWPDRKATEIPFEVKGLEGQECDGDDEIGVFEHEEVFMIGERLNGRRKA